MGIFNFFKNFFSPQLPRQEIMKQRAVYDPYSALGGILNNEALGSDFSLGSREQALEISTVLSTIKMLAEDTAALPLNISIKNNEDEITVMRQHPLQKLLNEKPNSRMTAYNMRKALIAILILHGNSFLYVRRTRLGAVIDMALVPPGKVNKIINANGSSYYTIMGIGDGGKVGAVRNNALLHFMQFTLNGDIGESLIDWTAAPHGITRGIQNYTRSLLKNNISPKVILYIKERAASQGDQTSLLKKIRQEWNDVYGGIKQAGQTAVLPPGVDIKEVLAPSKEHVELLGLRKVLLRDWLGVTRIPAHMLPGTAPEEKKDKNDPAYVLYALTPYLKIIETEMNTKLLTQEEREQGLYIKHDVSSLLQNDQETRTKYYQSMISMGAMTPNEVRKKEGLPGNKNKHGDKFFMPSNMLPLDLFPQKQEAEKNKIDKKLKMQEMIKEDFTVAIEKIKNNDTKKDNAVDTALRHVKEYAEAEIKTDYPFATDFSNFAKNYKKYFKHRIENMENAEDDIIIEMEAERAMQEFTNFAQKKQNERSKK